MTPLEFAVAACKYASSFCVQFIPSITYMLSGISHLVTISKPRSKIVRV